MSDKLDPGMMAQEIKKAIFSLVDEYSVLPDTIENDDAILELGILDSPGIMNLIAWYEENFEIEVGKSEFTIENLGTIESMVNFVLKRKEVQ